MNENETQLAKTQELFDFLQGKIPTGYKIESSNRPRLTPEQAWTVIWYLGNLHWKVTDQVERCDVCGDLFHTDSSGTCLDYGKSPYYFCDDCMTSNAYARKSKRNQHKTKAL